MDPPEFRRQIAEAKRNSRICGFFLRQLTGLEDMQAAKVCFISDFQLLGFMIELNIKKSSLGVEVERGIVIVICSKID